MSVTTTLGAYAAGLTVLFAGAFGVGSAVGPVGPAAGQHSDPTHRGDLGAHLPGGTEPAPPSTTTHQEQP